ncbi:MAG TPA: OmpH family outer membrane protein [Bryobacteraceae bacterium]|nr:OmpH family outer membrane protein [Bryobacteraceae bacterium]
MFCRFRSVLLVSALVCVSLAAARAQSIPPAHVAIINAQKAVSDTAEIKKAQALLEAKFKPRTQAIQTLQAQLESISKQLQAPNLQPDREAALRADGTQKQKELQRLNDDLNADVNYERQDVLTRAGRQMTEVVKKIAEERNLDIVIDITNTIYFKPALDITADATTAYDKAYPPK